MNGSQTAARPTDITVICILGFIGAAVTIPFIAADLAKSHDSWYAVFLGLSAFVGIICMIGLWLMRKWGAFLYLAFVIFNQAILVSTGFWSAISLILPAVVIAIAFANLARMR